MSLEARHEIDTQELAREVRRDVVRMTSKAGASHVSSGLSCVDILSVLYGHVMRFRPLEPEWLLRDQLVFSKGHAAAALYSVLARVGFFSVEAIDEFCQDGSPLVGHATTGACPGVELSTGSLGHGLSVACGIALGAKMQERERNSRTFCVVSDGECQEGSTWEAALFGAQHSLDSLTVIIDANGLQGLGPVSHILNIEPLLDKWTAFGWEAVEVAGHDHAALKDALVWSRTTARPSVILARTTKGYGVPFMEDRLEWHYQSVDRELLEATLSIMDV